MANNYFISKGLMGLTLTIIFFLSLNFSHAQNSFPANGDAEIKRLPSTPGGQSISRLYLTNENTGGGEKKWALQTAPNGGGYGVTPLGFDIWEYPEGKKRFSILPGGNIRADGSLGIGITPMDSRLHIDIPVGTNALKISSPSASFNFGAQSLSLNANSTWANVPYIQWVAPNGKRQGFMGWYPGYLNLTLDNGYNYSINGGKVGIGTTTPQANLSVVGAEGATFRLFHTSNANSYLNIWHGTGAAVIEQIGTGIMYLGYNSPSTIIMSRTGGNVLIGKSSQENNTYRLDVAGKVRANEIVVNTTGADFVFEKDYSLRPLSEVETFIQENKHLPEIPSAVEMQTEGMAVGELQARLLQKVEELTLYLIEQNKQIEVLNQKNKALENTNKTILELLKSIEQK